MTTRMIVKPAQLNYSIFPESQQLLQKDSRKIGGLQKIKLFLEYIFLNRKWLLTELVSACRKS